MAAEDRLEYVSRHGWSLIAIEYKKGETLEETWSPTNMLIDQIVFSKGRQHSKYDFRVARSIAEEDAILRSLGTLLDDSDSD